MPLLSRATAYIQMEKFEEARDDLLKVLGMPNVAIPAEVVPGSTTMHSAACVRLAKVYHELKEVRWPETGSAWAYSFRNGRLPFHSSSFLA